MPLKVAITPLSSSSPPTDPRINPRPPLIPPRQRPPPRHPAPFMSISPTDAQRSPPSPHARAQPRNPSSGHGSRRPHDRRRTAAAGDEPTAAIYGGLCDSPKNVIQLGFRSSRNGSSGQNSGAMSQWIGGHGRISSQFQSGHFAPAQIGGEPSETSNSRSSTEVASGSSGNNVNAAQSASRRNPVVSANHLLNFHYDPIAIERRQPYIPPRRKQKIRPYNKDLFLQANFKFVVVDTGSSQLESMDPDKMLQWEDVVCVKYSTPLSIQCPICLESPICPQITSCGHIYCFPCILQYLLMGQEDHKGDCWKKCPLCFMMISSKDLYTIHIDNVKQYHIGDHVHFTLLTRSKDSLVPSQKDQQGGVDLGTQNTDSISDIFSKFVLTSDVELSVRDAKLELNNWLCKAESGLVDDFERLPYVSAALGQLEERMKSWTEHRVFSDTSMRSVSSLSANLKVQHTLNKMQPNPNVTSYIESANSHGEPAGGTARSKSKTAESMGKMGNESSPFPFAVVPGSKERPERGIASDVEIKDLQTNKDAKERDSYTFYQAIDGQHLILHPLNMKCLLHHYGSYDLLPQRIDGKILELETVTQSDAMRRRYRYLSHFSLTTTFQLCEIDLSETLPPSSLIPFVDEIRKREKQRKRLSKKEEDDRARAEAAALPDWSIPPEHSRSSHKDTGFSLDDFTALGSNTVPSISPPITNERKLFSNVTRLGFAAAHDSPSLRSDEASDPSQGVKKMGEASSMQGPRAMPTLSFANIITTTKTVENPVNSNPSGKKGKKSTRVLLSTAGGRRY